MGGLEDEKKELRGIREVKRTTLAMDSRNNANSTA